jgi:hypothetical protein
VNSERDHERVNSLRPLMSKSIDASADHVINKRPQLSDNIRDAVSLRESQKLARHFYASGTAVFAVIVDFVCKSID